jgi:hypothetical protein
MQNDNAAKGKKTCKEDGCERNARKRGWCQMHYKRWQTHGDPTIVGKKQPKGPEFYFAGPVFPYAANF